VEPLEDLEEESNAWTKKELNAMGLKLQIELRKVSISAEWRREDKMLEVRGYRRGRKRGRLRLNGRT